MKFLLGMAALAAIVRPVASQSEGARADSFTVRLAVPSHGDTLSGFIRVAAGAGPHLTVLFLQGFPGGETPTFPATMQAAGFNGVGFSYRGNFRSSGNYTLEGTAEDAETMVGFLRSDSARRLWRVDPDRIVVVGASSGTLATLRTAAGDPRIACAAAMVPFNWAPPAMVARTDTVVRGLFVNVFREVTRGPTPAIRENGLLERIFANAESYDLRPAGAELGKRKVMLVGALRDATAPLPVHFTPLVEVIRKAGGAGLRDTVVDDTHNLPNTGDAVAAAIVRWLRSDCVR